MSHDGNSSSPLWTGLPASALTAQPSTPVSIHSLQRLFIYLFTYLFIFLGSSEACGSSQTRDVTAATTLDSLTARPQGNSLRFFFFFPLGPHLWHKEVPRLGVQSELQLLVYTTATVTQNLSPICDLCHSLHQCQILNPLNETRDRTWILMDMMSGS